MIMIHKGDIVERKPVTFGNSPDGRTQLMRGTVVYVHPLGRFHVVEFGKGQRIARESFLGIEMEER